MPDDHHPWAVPCAALVALVCFLGLVVWVITNAK